MTQWIFVEGSCSCTNPIPQSDDSTSHGSELPHQLDERGAGEEEPELTVSDEILPTQRYKVLQELGRGASGIVYLCRDRLLGKKVAVKTLRRLTKEQLIAFQTEARATSKLTHPAILTLLDFGPTTSGAPYMVLEYFDGITLEEYLERNSLLPVPQAISVFDDLADALSVAHDSKIFHRDLKPSNVLIRFSDSGRPIVKLIDFGVARVKEETLSPSDSQGMTLAGTPAYMSPDTFAGGVYDARSEVYSLGCLVFHCLTGRPPFQAATALELLRKHAEEAPPGLFEAYAQESSSSTSPFPISLEMVISKCLSKHPDDRHSSMQELKNEIKYRVAVVSFGQEVSSDSSQATSQFQHAADWRENRAASIDKPSSLALRSSNTMIAASILVVTVVLVTVGYAAIVGGVFNTKSVAKVERKKSSSFRSNTSAMGHSKYDLSDPTAVSKQLESLEQFDEEEAALRESANIGDSNAAFALSEIHFKRAKTNPEEWKQCLYWVRRAADAGHSAAINDLGFLYENGYGVKQDYKEAGRWYRKSAEQNNYVAKNNLGMLYKVGRGVPQNLPLAIKLITEAAKEGNATAQFNLGYAYLYNAVPRDYGKALLWLQRSAKQGYVESLANLGHMHEEGLGVQKDFGIAVQYYRQAARQSSSTAINNLGGMYEFGKGVRQDYPKALELYKRAASLGNAMAISNIGNLYADGKGVKQDRVEAVKWFTKAAEQDVPIAVNNLGYAYMEGRGVPVDYKKAMSLYRRAAAQRYTLAKHNIGWMYQFGFGVKVDYKEALKWFREAADDGYGASINQIGFFYKCGLGVEKDYKKAKDYFTRAAEKGEAQAYENLAELYECGYGVPVSYPMAIRYRKTAMRLGSPEAFNNMALLFEKGTGVPQDYEEAEKLYIRSAEMGCSAAKEHLKKLYARRQGGHKTNAGTRPKP